MAETTGTILVVDDDVSVRRLTTRMLQQHGFCVIEAECGTDGLERFSEHHNNVDLVLSDVMMPKMSGTEMVEQILTINPSVRVLMMTGFAVEAMLPKAVPIVSKPFTSDALVQSVKACLAA